MHFMITSLGKNAESWAILGGYGFWNIMLSFGTGFSTTIGVPTHNLSGRFEQYVMAINDDDILTGWRKLQAATEDQFNEVMIAEESRETSIRPRLLSDLIELAVAISHHTKSPDIFRNQMLGRADIWISRNWYWPHRYGRVMEPSFAEKKRAFHLIDQYFAESNEVEFRYMFDPSPDASIDPCLRESLYFMCRWDSDLWDIVKAVYSQLKENGFESLRDPERGHSRVLVKKLWVTFVRALLRSEDITEEEESEVLKTLHAGGGCGPWWRWRSAKELILQKIPDELPVGS